jgi:peptidoglycan/LPS O-acetylase OafA/YrhL
LNPVNPLPAATCLLIAVATSSLLVKKFGKPITHDRYASLDGLRGYLAFFVFLHHSIITYFYLKTGEWRVPPSNLYTHFGQSSVAMFFMITGFLFFSKLIDGKTKTIDWGRLFVSRFIRLTPLYLFAMSIMFIIVAVLSQWNLNEPIMVVFKEAMHWLIFSIGGQPNINGIPDTSTIIAGVTWSLPYEWRFYLMLPVLALFVGVKPPLPYLVLGFAATISLIHGYFYFYKWIYFLGGIAAAFLVRNKAFKDFSVKPIASLIAIGCLIATVTIYPSAYS